MRSWVLLAAALPLVQGIRIVQSNDDGWSEANLRTFFNVLNSAGHQVVLSGPAENQSGTGLSWWFLSRSTRSNSTQAPPTAHLLRLTLMAASTLPAQVEARPLVLMPQILGSTMSTHIPSQASNMESTLSARSCGMAQSHNSH